MSEHIENLVSLEPGEKVLSEIRRHMFVLYVRLIPVVVLFFLPFFAMPFVILFLRDQLALEHPVLIVVFLYLLWLLLLLIWFAFRWTDYYLDVWVITSKRIFDIEQLGAFNRNISVFRLENLEDITVETQGLLATLLKFGDIKIHTAGQNRNLTIKTAAYPMEKKKIILDAQSEAVEEHAHTHIPQPSPASPPTEMHT